MDKYWLERTELLIKEDGLEKLIKANVLVVPGRSRFFCR